MTTTTLRTFYNPRKVAPSAKRIAPNPPLQSNTGSKRALSYAVARIIGETLWMSTHPTNRYIASGTFSYISSRSRSVCSSL